MKYYQLLFRSIVGRNNDIDLDYQVVAESSDKNRIDEIIKKYNIILNDNLYVEGFSIKTIDKVDFIDENSIKVKLKELEEKKQTDFERELENRERKARGEYCIFDSEFWENLTNK